MNTHPVETKGKVLIGPSSFGECGPEPLEILRRGGLTVVPNPNGRRLSESEVIHLASDCVGIIAGVEPLTGEVLGKLPRLQCISRCGAGLENVDLEEANRRRISVKNTPDGPTRAVAELTIGLILSLLRKIPQAGENLRRGIWKKETGNLLYEKIVGVIGLGRVGRLVSELLAPFGCRLLGCDPKPDPVWTDRLRVRLVSLDELLEQSDMVSLHLSHSAGAPPVLGVRQLARMKRGAWLVNLSRGSVVDEQALHDALVSGRLSGAALDVFVEEPYQGPLSKLSNVVATPHLGSYALESKLRMEIQSALNLLDGLRGPG